MQKKQLQNMQNMKPLELKGEMDKFTIMVGNFNTLLTGIGRTRQKISKELEELNAPINENISK